MTISPNKSRHPFIIQGLANHSLIVLFLIALFFGGTATANEHENNTKLIVANQQLGQHLEPELTAGRWQLVMFWATWCSVCKSDFKHLQAFLAERPELKLDLMGVAFDGIEEEEKARALVKKYNLHYTHILTTKEVAAEYYSQAAEEELIGPPSYLLFNKENQVAATSSNAIDLDSLELFLD